jgi:hypothetical protein
MERRAGSRGLCRKSNRESDQSKRDPHFPSGLIIALSTAFLGKMQNSPKRDVVTKGRNLHLVG